MRWWLLVSLVALPGRAVADADGSITAAELKALRDDPVVFTDGKGHYFAFPRTPKANSYAPTYYGEKSVMYRSTDVRMEDDGTLEASAGIRGLLWFFTRRAGAVSASCGNRKVALEAVPRDLARRLVRDATFKVAPKWDRTPLRLARDDAGVYYYVDGVSRADREAFDHRLFIGKRGGARQVKLKDIIIDTAGELYISEVGTFKVQNPPTGSNADEETWWIAKGGSTRLSTVPPIANSALVYTALGAYIGEMFGYPCDVF